ncbi:MAG: hypothetical protein UW94_C0008G0046 [Parcubacteria group bacterium GW2011_GWA2_45_14]|nr:MAG: hypothetical protein UW94_C0008G0046 [Parcubacteria group bacterium GW2011_GWA2_45_14]
MIMLADGADAVSNFGSGLRSGFSLQVVHYYPGMRLNETVLRR